MIVSNWWLQATILLFFSLQTTDGLVCYSCNNARSHEECNRRKVICDRGQKASCMIEIRNGGRGVGELISKGCKQINACVNNNNNPNNHNCCCTGNGCNRNGTTCANDNIKPVTLRNGVKIQPKWKSYHSQTAGQWGPWLSWSGCSAHCGGGIKRRRRVGYGAGSNFMEGACNTQPCQNGGASANDLDQIVLRAKLGEHVQLKSSQGFNNINAGWDQWESWGACSTKCGKGYRTRSRKCYNENVCAGSPEQKIICMATWGCKDTARVANVKKPSQFKPWAQWSACSKPCGGGEQTRRRECLGSRCQGQLSQRQSCNTSPCATWSQWTNFGECDAECGGGVAIRTRDCIGAGPCSNSLDDGLDEKACNTFTCDGWSSWAPWSACSADCGSPGQQSRSRKCQTDHCPGESTQQEPCLEQCPTWSDWGKWSECDATCGDGYQTRDRTCSVLSKCDGPASERLPCNKGQCAQWGEWSDYGSCDTECGDGWKSRNRLCFGIGNCDGSNEQREICSNGDCAAWSQWAEWSVCSQSCGAGQHHRTRACGGLGDCAGDAIENGSCSIEKCPTWSEWGNWGACSAECNGGNRSRQRTCSGEACPGESRDVMECNVRACAAWSAWGDWTECSASCGEGNRSKQRQCEGHGQCEGDSNATESCNKGACAAWGLWGNWAACSASCGGGFRVRGRSCDGKGECSVGYAKQKGRCALADCKVYGQWGEWGTCSGTCTSPDQEPTEARQRKCLVQNKCRPIDLIERRSCSNVPPCPSWSEWAEWSQCSVSCASGISTRTRYCQNGTDCVGDKLESKECTEAPCPSWASWLEWTSCSVTCGDGSRNRRRVCINGDDCKGEASDVGTCSMAPCASWSLWAEWSTCSLTCGGGIKARARVCENGTECEGESAEQAKCNQMDCPRWMPWNEWTPCTESCGGGTKRRKRKCKDENDTVVDGSMCDNSAKANFDSTTCNTGACPTWSLWSSWSECSQTCGSGMITRGRTCQFGDSCEGDHSETDHCHVKDCASPLAWTQWASCSATCGDGTQTRTRQCSISGECNDYSLDETRKCTLERCPRWGLWTEWSDCPVTCGSSIETRNRDCLYSTDPAACLALGGIKTDSRECVMKECPFWSEWRDWGECSSTCGGGKRRRSRGCMYGPGCKGGKDNAFELEDCAQNTCAEWTQWSDFGSCSVTCGSGNKSRSRSCSGDDCPGDSSDSVSCDAGPCPVWSEWSNFSSCSVTCGDGVEKRSRTCPGGVIGHDCYGEMTESVPCSNGACPSWSNWSPFSECSVSCGGGSKSRSRVCRNGYDCPGADEETLTCNEEKCASWSEWTEYGACSVTCGSGTQSRSRQCDNGDDCYGEMTDTKSCSKAACPPDFEEWGEWSPCSASCGPGKSSRRRVCNLSESECYSKMLERRSCNKGACAPKADWSEWGQWSPCTATCNGGMHYRSRECLGGSSCPGMNFEHGRCNTDSCDAGCPGKRDVLFVMHSSTGMRDSYDQIKNFFYDIVKQINIDPSPETIRFSMSLYSHQYENFFDFTMLDAMDQYGWAFEALPQPRTMHNYLGNAMKAATKQMSSGSPDGRRDRTPGVVVLLTNSISSDDVQSAIGPLKDVVDRLIVVGLGHAVDKMELEMISSKPIKDNFIHVYKAGDLVNHVKHVTQAICETKVSSAFACRTAGCQDQCTASYSGAECMCSTGRLGDDGKSCSVTCMDETGQARQPGETWDVDGMFGMSCECLSNGELDCDMSSFDFSNYAHYF